MAKDIYDKTHWLYMPSKKRSKWFWILSAALLWIGGFTIIVLAVEFISIGIWGVEKDLASLIKYFNPFLRIAGLVFLILFMAFGTLILYNYLINHEQLREKQRAFATVSPLLGEAKEQEQQIIELLRSVAKPSYGKQYLNRAPTAQFLRALTELGYMDSNITGPNLMAWVEFVTGYQDKDRDAGHFFAAYNKPTKEDTKVQEYMTQISQLLHT